MDANEVHVHVYCISVWRHVYLYIELSTRCLHVNVFVHECVSDVSMYMCGYMCVCVCEYYIYMCVCVCVCACTRCCVMFVCMV